MGKNLPRPLQFISSYVSISSCVDYIFCLFPFCDALVYACVYFCNGCSYWHLLLSPVNLFRN